MDDRIRKSLPFSTVTFILAKTCAMVLALAILNQL
jgi:hypothetical protein